MVIGQTFQLAVLSLVMMILPDKCWYLCSACDHSGERGDQEIYELGFPKTAFLHFQMRKDLDYKLMTKIFTGLVEFFIQRDTYTTNV